MAEGTSLLRMHTAYTCIVGSNPTVSARTKENGLPCGRPFFFVRTETQVSCASFEDSRVLAREVSLPEVEKGECNQKNA